MNAGAEISIKNGSLAKKRNEKLFGKIIITIVVSIVGVVFILPFLWMISTSLKKPFEVFIFPIEWIPKDIQFENYKNVWTNDIYPFYKFYLNSIKVAALTIFGAILVSSAAGYAFAKIQFKGKNTIFLIYLATLMVPTQVTLVPRFALFYWLGIYNTHWALILPNLFFVVGIFMLRQFYISIPIELSESAKIDGAGHIRIWLQIITPLTVPALVSLIILVFVMSWNEYLNPVIFITSKELYTIPLGIQAFLEDELKQYNKVMAAATSAILPIMIVFLLLQRYFIQGVVTSGLKG